MDTYNKLISELNDFEKKNSIQAIATKILEIHERENGDEDVRIQHDIPLAFKLYIKQLSKIKKMKEKDVIKEIILSHIQYASTGSLPSLF